MGTDTDDPVNLYRLSLVLRLPMRWLRDEAQAGRIPCLNAGGKLLFNVAAVKAALGERAATATAPTPEVRHG